MLVREMPCPLWPWPMPAWRRRRQICVETLNLGYTSVTAPISGVTSLEAVPEGSVVGTESGNSLLTRINQTDPIFVAFSFYLDDLTEIRRLR